MDLKNRSCRRCGTLSRSHQGKRNLKFESLEARNLLSLTHLYTFNDGTANDWVGDADGVLFNGASIVNGELQLGNVQVDSGDADRVQYAHLPADLLPAGAATIEVWYTQTRLESWARVFDFGSQDGGGGDSYLYFTNRSGPGDARTALKPSGSSERVVTTLATTAGAEQMASIVIDSGAGLLRLYIDGVQQGTTPLNGASASSAGNAVSYLGRSLFNADPGFTGRINELRIYDQALSPAEIAAHAAAGHTTALAAGDYQPDGDIDGGDFLAWQTGDGSEIGLDVWQQQYVGPELPPQTLDLHDESVSLPSISDTNVTLTGDSELHVTSSRVVIRNSIINLDSEDAWLFLESVKPSAVVSGFLDQVRVNGSQAIHDVNVRVVQHGLGSVILPHAHDFHPLEVFSGPHFTGTSQALDQYTYYSDVDHSSFDPLPLGDLNENISSFTLKRGYMATLATNPDGSGLSQVFVAQDEDLTVPLLSPGFDNSVEFVRVLPWRWVSKKGASDLAPDILDAAWHYNWNNSLDSTFDYEYVPIRQQRWWPSYPHARENVTHLLGYNEPDNPVEDAYQTLGNGSITTALSHWPELLSTGLRVGSPAVTDGGKAWLYEFMDRAIAQDLRVDYIAIHNYQCGHSAASLKSWLQDVYDRYHLPIWITEFNNGANWTGCGDPTQTQNAAVIDSFIEMMDTTPWIERYSIYSRVEAVRELTYADGSLTPTGQVYHDNESPIGYVQEVYSAANTEDRSIMQLPLGGDVIDTSGYGSNGYVHGGAEYVTGQVGEALDLNGSTDYVELRDNVAHGDEFTFAGWVNWDGGGNWQRIFDFGNDTSEYLFLTPSNGSSMRFAIKNGGSEQIVQTSPLATNQWTHVAVTVGGGSAKLYVNGTLVDTNNGVTITPSDFHPTRNFLGNSQFDADPLFNGQLDEVLVTDYALTLSQIAGLMNNSAPEFTTSTISLGPIVAGSALSNSLAGSATDADAGDTLTYEKANGPAWLTVAPNGTLSGTPSLADGATQDFVVTATDSNGAVGFAVLTIAVDPVGPLSAVAAAAEWEDTQSSDASEDSAREEVFSEIDGEASHSGVEPNGGLLLEDAATASGDTLSRLTSSEEASQQSEDFLASLDIALSAL